MLTLIQPFVSDECDTKYLIHLILLAKLFLYGFEDFSLLKFNIKMYLSKIELVKNYPPDVRRLYAKSARRIVGDRQTDRHPWEINKGCLFVCGLKQSANV